jgi:phosphoglycerate dehydrogenase-like enzyme
MRDAPRRLVVDLRDARPNMAVPAETVDAIRAALPEAWEMVVVGSPADGRGDGGGASDEAVEAARGAEVYLGWGLSPEVFRAATEGDGARLRWVHSASAGVGGALFPAMRASDVVLTNSAGIYAEPMAETVLAAILHFSRGLDVVVRAQQERRWAKGDFAGMDAPVRELSEMAVGIVGLGGIGQAVARRCVALGMRVRATRRTGTEAPEGVELLRGDGALDRLLASSDVLVVAAPLTGETRARVGARELAMLPAGAVVVNVARGGIVDEAALADALASGRMRGAALDVFDREPLPPSSPLWGLSNVLVTPHVSGVSHLFWRRQTRLILENTGRYLRGAPLLNTVDKTAGY